MNHKKQSTATCHLLSTFLDDLYSHQEIFSRYIFIYAKYTYQSFLNTVEFLCPVNRKLLYWLIGKYYHCFLKYAT